MLMQRHMVNIGLVAGRNVTVWLCSHWEQVSGAELSFKILHWTVHSHGSELGHITIDSSADARQCPCGQFGHLEAYVSATSVAKRTQEQLDEGENLLCRQRGQNKE